eukprot:11172827-Lingulodinium_polyedra.AAC.1
MLRRCRASSLAVASQGVKRPGNSPSSPNNRRRPAGGCCGGGAQLPEELKTLFRALEEVRGRTGLV